MAIRFWSVRLTLGAMLGLTGLTSTGCGREPTPTAPPRDPAIALDTPENTARSLLRLLDAQLQAVSARDREAARQARDQVAWHVAARKDILHRFLNMAGARSRDPNKVIGTLVESWAAAVEYYAGGRDLNAMHVDRGGPGSTSALVRVPVRAGEMRAELRVGCVRDLQTQEWQVIALDLAPPAEIAATAATTRPAALPITPATTQATATSNPAGTTPK